jgi:AcrR family transcriptional regulator
MYHDRMTIPRQPPQPTNSGETGRVNQKRRTRSAIVVAAAELLDQGVTPTVAQAAEAALVSRTTAYRYFPTQESLLLEITLHADVDDIEVVANMPVDAATAGARALEVLDLFNRHVLAEELRFRNAMRVYQDLWVAASAAGDDAPVVREGRRKRWFETCLAPLRVQVGDAAVDRLIAGLCALGGMEAMTALRDVSRLEPEQALAVTDWAARVLVEATLADGGGDHA